MKKFLLLVLIFVVHINMYSQYSPKKSSFSYFSLGLYGGFSTDDFVLFDTSSLFEIKTNLTQKLFVHLSTGYNSFDKSANIDDVNSVSYEYKIIPVSLGASYFILHGHSSPYLIMEGGYNFCKNTIASGSNKENFFNLGLGGGIYYNMHKHWKMDFKYLYKFNDGFDNIHHLIVGFVYSF